MTNENYGYQQASAQMDSIAAMVAALTCDYDRLEELRDERDDLQDAINRASGEELQPAKVEMQKWLDENIEELNQLADAAGECTDQDEARQRIEEDAISVEVRSAWVSPGEEMKADQFRIVLCTGGPHVELVGELDDYGQPCRVWMNYKDWGTSGEYHGENFDHDALMAYASCFYFGE